VSESYLFSEKYGAYSMEKKLFLLRVGKRGEIYTKKELREKLGIIKGSYVKAYIENNKMIIEPLPSIEELVKDTFATLTPEEAEKISEKIQKEAKIFG